MNVIVIKDKATQTVLGVVELPDDQGPLTVTEKWLAMTFGLPASALEKLQVNRSPLIRYEELALAFTPLYLQSQGDYI